jgi:GT2 family glycosyltransferase
VNNGKYPGTYKVSYKINGEPLVSIVIPFKDKPDLLKMSIESVLEKSTYQNYEIIGVSNNSEEKETFEMMTLLEKKDKRVKFVEYNKPFNYSAINNYAVDNIAKGEHIVLMNNDIEIITSKWIEELLHLSRRESTGVVGAKLYYPDDTIQHAGVIVGLGGVAGHSHKYFSQKTSGYFHRLHLIQNLSALTAALFMVKKSIYNEVDGLNENDLRVAFNDVDFCLRVQEKGYLNVFTPYCEAYHHESVSRGAEDNPEKIKRFNNEVEYMKKRHSEILKNGDPFYNINLTLDYENFGLK